jgi:hypothetical protein
MALLQRKGEEREDELMLFNTANQSKKFIAVGDEFNGGTLIYVHQRGGVGLRGGKYSVYPLGMALSNEIPAESAQEYPELLRAVTFHRDAVAELTRKKEAEAAAPQAPGLQVPEGGEEGSTPEVNGKWSPEVVQEGAAEVIEGPMPDPAPADVTAAPSGATGTSGDMPPADSATDSQEKAEKEQTGSSKPPETKRRPTRNRRPR